MPGTRLRGACPLPGWVLLAVSGVTHSRRLQFDMLTLLVSGVRCNEQSLFLAVTFYRPHPSRLLVLDLESLYPVAEITRIFRVGKPQS